MEAMRMMSYVIFLFVFLALAIEASYRLVKGPVPSATLSDNSFCIPDETLGYRFRPGAVAPQGRDVNCINNVGFRGEDISVPKPPGVYRILCVGDSATNGVNVHNSQTFPGILGEMLQKTKFKDSIHVEVVNAGVPGYLSDHHLYLLDNNYLRLEPDLIVFMMGVTDVSATLMTSETWDAIRNITRDKKFLPKFFDVFFQGYSSAYYYGSRQLHDYIDIHKLEKREKSDLTSEIEKELKVYEDNYQKMINKCREQGVLVLNVNFPWNFTSRVGREDNYVPLKDAIKYYEFNLYWQAMPILSRKNNELAVKNGLINVDVQGDVLRAKDRMIFFWKNDFSHPSIQGNFLIASSVYRTLVDHFLQDKVVGVCDGIEIAKKYLLGMDN